MDITLMHSHFMRMKFILNIKVEVLKISLNPQTAQSACHVVVKM